MITIAELIQKLKSYPPELRVVLPGYEGGYNDLTRLGTINLALNVHPEDYYGNHDDVNYKKGNYQTEKALFLWGERQDD